MDTFVTALHPEPAEQLEHNTRVMEQAFSDLAFRDGSNAEPVPDLVAL